MNAFGYFILGVSLTINVTLGIDYIKKSHEYKVINRRLQEKALKDEKFNCPIAKE